MQKNELDAITEHLKAVQERNYRVFKAADYLIVWLFIGLFVGCCFKAFYG